MEVLRIPSVLNVLRRARPVLWSICYPLLSVYCSTDDHRSDHSGTYHTGPYDDAGTHYATSYDSCANHTGSNNDGPCHAGSHDAGSKYPRCGLLGVRLVYRRSFVRFLSVSCAPECGRQEYSPFDGRVLEAC